MTKHICVYCSSSNAIDPLYFDVADSLGIGIAQQGWTLVYGGGNVGLMGRTAQAVHAYNGNIIGVIPTALRIKEVCYEACDELIVTETMRERKAIMDARADAFIALPGGFGTLEELLEIITAKQLKFHQKPIILLNINGFFDPLLAMFDQIFAAKFARIMDRELYTVVNSSDEAINHIHAYQPPNIPDKWL